MRSREHGSQFDPDRLDIANPPIEPTALPPELAEFLSTQNFACLTQATDRGTVFVVKAPESVIQSVQGRVPILLRHELYEHPAAPVIRITTTIYDQPRSPLWLETFINVQDPDQRADYAALATQPELVMLFYDEALRHRLTKGVGPLDNRAMHAVQERADRYLATIPATRFDFDLAKRAIMEGSLD